MQIPYRRVRALLSFSLLLVLSISSVACATEAVGELQPASSDTQQIEALLATLEDPERREQLIRTLRALVQANQAAGAASEPVDFKTAAADLVERLSTKVAQLAAAAGALAVRVEDLPGSLRGVLEGLQEPRVRAYWLRVIGQLLLVLGSGFAVAAAVAWASRRIRLRRSTPARLSFLGRLSRLLGHLAIDLLPVAVFVLVAYATLTALDPSQDVRLVGVALINASVLSRLIQVGSAFLCAPDTPQLRLWQASDATARYLHRWVKRLSFIAVYGFFGLQASLLLGLDPDSYRMLLRLLALIVLALVLLLVVQNREPVRRVIAAEPPVGTDEPQQLSSLRKAFGRVWHLVAGLYLVAIYVVWTLQLQDGAQYLLQATLLSLIVLALARLLNRGADRLFDRGRAWSFDLQDRFSGLPRRLGRYLPALRKLVKLAIGLFALLAIVGAWGVDALTWATDGNGGILLGAVLKILLIVAAALLLWELASGGVERYLAQTDGAEQARIRSSRIKTLLTVARNAVLVLLTVVATLMVLSELGLNIGPLLAGAGVAGLAIGFGAQRLVQDVINGAFILFQDLMAVGDVVKLGDKAGVVEALSIRTVRLRDLAGTVHTLPFSAIEGVSNLTREFAYHVFDIGIAYRENVDEVIALLRAIGEELRADAEIGPLILEPLEVFGLDAFGDSAIVIKGRIKTQPIKQWQVGRAFNRLVKQRFDERGIEIPFPHTTLYFGQDKQGAAAPAFVQLEAMLGDASTGSANAVSPTPG